MKKIILIVFTIFFPLIITFAQVKLITCHTEQNTDNTLSIIAESQAFGQHTVKLIFKSFEGFKSNINTPVALFSVRFGKSELAKLTLNNSAIPPSLNFSYNYFHGVALNRKPDSNFVYLIPGSRGNRLFTFPVTSLQEIINHNTTNYFYITGFRYQLGDTICAVRAGEIYLCSDEVKEGEKGGQIFNRERNFIYIEHKDGTLSQYSIPAPIKLLVKSGDYVIPGQPLAFFNKESESYKLIFSVDYLDEKKVLSNTNAELSIPPISPYIYLSTVFYDGDISRGTRLSENKQYTIQHPKEIIGAELSKKDKKKNGIE